SEFHQQRDVGFTNCCAKLATAREFFSFRQQVRGRLLGFESFAENDAGFLLFTNLDFCFALEALQQKRRDETHEQQAGEHNTDSRDQIDPLCATRICVSAFWQKLLKPAEKVLKQSLKCVRASGLRDVFRSCQNRFKPALCPFFAVGRPRRRLTFLDTRFNCLKAFEDLVELLEVVAFQLVQCSV